MTTDVVGQTKHTITSKLHAIWTLRIMNSVMRSTCVIVSVAMQVLSIAKTMVADAQPAIYVQVFCVPIVAVSAWAAIVSVAVKAALSDIR